jgi:hypothetical protein
MSAAPATLTEAEAAMLRKLPAHNARASGVYSDSLGRDAEIMLSSLRSRRLAWLSSDGWWQGALAAEALKHHTSTTRSAT